MSSRTPCLSNLIQAYMHTRGALTFLCDWHEHTLMCCMHVCVKSHLLHKGLDSAYHDCRIRITMATHYEVAMFAHSSDAIMHMS